jgi:hypothetical protein
MVTQRLHVNRIARVDHYTVIVIKVASFVISSPNSLERVGARVGAILPSQETFEGLVINVIWRKCAQDVLVTHPWRLPTMASTCRAQASLFASMLSRVSAEIGWELGLQIRPTAGKIRIGITMRLMSDVL